MLRKVTLLVPALIISALITGCSTFEEGAPEAVSVQSFPAGADVYLNNEVVGKTPCEVELGRKSTATIRLEKEGYKSKSISVVPKENEHAQDVVRFGPLYDMGYYHELTPNPVEVELEPAELPRSRSADQYSQMVELISQVDQQRENGEISPLEHKYKVEKIIEFYSK